MRLSLRLLGCATGALLAGISLSLAAPVRLELAKGGELKGELLSEDGDRVVIDLGFTVLSVPRDTIVKLDKQTAATTGGEPAQGPDLWRDASTKTAAGSVKDISAQVGEAVVLVRTPTGLGSGFIIHPDGYVVTNDHVVAGETELNLTFFEGSGKDMRKVQFDKVRIIAASPDNDLALLKIEGAGNRKFKSVPLADFESVKQGTPVFAIGSPLGLERSVSSGIVSLRNRLNSGRLYIQTTTAINSGNSGGPLFNLKGEVIGVNNMKLSSAGVEGLGFAIPNDTLKMFLKNRDAFAFDPRNPNAGYRYVTPPGDDDGAKTKSEK
jgi:serine protease Do